MRVFWRKGYAPTTLSDLTEAMGINRASLYAAFGNKESLFRRVLDHYVHGPFSYFREALEAPTAREVVQRLLQGGANLGADARNPSGCLWVRGALSHGDRPRLRREMSTRRRRSVLDLERRLAQAVDDGDLPGETDPQALALFVQAIHLGIQVQAISGATRADLAKVVQVATEAMFD
ncbi:MAG: TetR/AcrR family transcriptional regulator [Gemmatimonadota bacterium]